MPAISALQSQLDRMAGPDEIRAQDIPLWLPSNVGLDGPCDLQLQKYEWKLRYAQANDSLNDMRRHLCYRSHLWKHKDRFIRGQTLSMQSHTIIDQCTAKLDACIERYTVARQALVVLAPLLDMMGWENTLKVLNKDMDVHTLTEPLFGDSEGSQTLSWIWLTTLATDDQDTDSLNEGGSDFICLFKILLMMVLQLYGLNGAERELGQRDGRRK
jgi:hypothetical protein